MPTAADDFQSAQEKEWSQLVAIEAISIDGVRAFNPGDPVHVDHVKRGVVDKSQVAGRDTKAAQAVTQPEG